jgi:hypothetical protein
MDITELILCKLFIFGICYCANFIDEVTRFGRLFVQSFIFVLEILFYIVIILEILSINFLNF